MGFEGDMDDWLDEKDPKRHERLADALKKQEEAAARPFPPAALPEGQNGVILLRGYSKVTGVNSGWRVEGGWMDK